MTGLLAEVGYEPKANGVLTAWYQSVDGADLAAFVRDQSGDHAPEIVVAQSARNRFPGIVTRVVIPSGTPGLTGLRA